MPFIAVSERWLEEGDPVYAFGFPLPSYKKLPVGTANVELSLNSRITSAIVSAKEGAHYVLDKALNYGNSGGPIVSVDTGRVEAFCSRFQPVHIPQYHLSVDPLNPVCIIIPSLYSYVVSLSHAPMQEEFAKRGIIPSDGGSAGT